MSKLNARVAPGNAVASGKMGYSENGNLQAVHTAETQLYQLITNSLYGNDTFYANDQKRVERLETAITKCVVRGNLDFVANAIVYGRKVMNIRTMPIVAAVLFAKVVRDCKKEYPDMKYVIRDVIRRADQLTDLFAYALTVFGDKKHIPRAVLKGIGLAFHKFDEYQFAKYKGGNKTITLSAALRLSHPQNATPEQGAIFEKIIKDTLSIPDTWETKLSINGQLGHDKLTDTALWTELLTSGKVGYLALMRNLRNIHNANVSLSVIREHVIDVITNPDLVQKNGMLPFQYDRAMMALDDCKTDIAKALRSAVATAVDHAVVNMRPLGNRVWIILDESGSMKHDSHDKQNKKLPNAAYIASHFVAALMKTHNNVDKFHITGFATSARTIRPLKGNVYDIQSTIYKNITGGGTAIKTALQEKSGLGFEPDTVILLSDMEVDSTAWSTDTNVTSMFAPDCLKIAINLGSGETTPVSEKQGWMQLAGWSDNLFKLIPAIRETGSLTTALSHKFVPESLQPRKSAYPATNKVPNLDNTESELTIVFTTE